MFNTLIALIFMVIMGSWVYYKNSYNINENNIIKNEIIIHDPPSLQMFYSILKYSEMYEIPDDFAFGIARYETGYLGPFQWNYKHDQISHMNAQGPMQVMYPTAKYMWPDLNFTEDFLRKNIDFNVHTSMKYLRYLHDRHGNWALVFGAYNTGRPMVNSYASSVYSYDPNLKFNINSILNL